MFNSFIKNKNNAIVEISNKRSNNKKLVCKKIKLTKKIIIKVAIIKKIQKIFGLILK